MTDARTPFSPGHVGVLLAPHDLAASQVVEEMLADARVADRVGFDGVLVGEVLPRLRAASR